jgi:hypothetical protein
MRFDKVSSNFVPTEKRKMNSVVVSYEVDHANHRVLKEMLNHANVVSELMQGMGLKLNHLLPTNRTLFTADKKSLTVLGAVAVIISVKCGDGSTATTRDILYSVEELTSVCSSAVMPCPTSASSARSSPRWPRLGGRGPGVQCGHRHQPALHQAGQF